MLHRTYTPVSPLGDFVDDFRLYDDYVPGHLKDRILPSGTIELVINLREDEFRIYHPGRPGRCERFPGALVSGAYGRIFLIDTAEDASVIGVHFRPGGAFPFLGLPAGELADAHVDLETLWGRAAVELRERLCVAATPAERFRLLEEALLARLFRPLIHHDAVSVALDAFGRMDAGSTVQEVARRVGLSHRRFIQIFSAEVGITPKLFCRIQRFQRTIAMVRQIATPDWAQVAGDCGYFDQSHMIRDFLAFSGLSPAAYVRQQHRLRQEDIHEKRNHVPVAE
jgi:AraC-like DNA-binding protein